MSLGFFIFKFCVMLVSLFHAYIVLLCSIFVGFILNLFLFVNFVLFCERPNLRIQGSAMLMLADCVLSVSGLVLCLFMKWVT